MMDAVEQEIVIRIHPACREPEDWRVQAYVFGEWAVHELHPLHDDPRVLGFAWQISHIPSGAIAYVGKDKAQLLEAAGRIADLTLPTMRVFTGDDGEPKLPPMPPTFARAANERVADLAIYAVCGDHLYRPRNVWSEYKRVLKRRAKQ